VALDRDNKLYTWSVQKRFHSTDLLELSQNPTVVKALRKKQIQSVFPGYNSIFALSEDVIYHEPKPSISEVKNDAVFEKNPILKETLSQERATN
jgi:hypothetical protein